MKGGDEMVEMIMVIAALFFIAGLGFNKVLEIAANEWREARKEPIND